MASEKRLIDANALVKDLELLAKHEDAFRQSVILGVVHTVKAQPTVDAVEVVHGRWIKDGDWLICLNCESEINIKNSLGIENHKNYCPHCGTKMDGERKDK